MSNRNNVAYSPLETDVGDNDSDSGRGSTSKHFRPPKNPLDQLSNDNSILSTMLRFSSGYGHVDGSSRSDNVKKTVFLIGAGAIALSFFLSITNDRFGGGIMGRTNNNNRKPPNHSSYRILSSDYLQEYNSVLTIYQHAKTLAEMVTLIPTEPTQDDKAFGISFRTVPTDSTGVAHIMEHSVLCGSNKFPTKDPFLHLMKGSLNTFLNAMTYPDRTVYPVASRNAKDLKNLMDVYLDAVFFPRAVKEGEDGEWVLMQEGWRYEVEEDDGGEQELVYKGVVYSEMKGVYSDPDSLLDRFSQHLLYPDNTYQHDSGGDPEFIPSLTHEQFVNFHRTFYHPTNSQSFLYGNKDDAEDALSMLDGYLSQFNEDVNARKQSEIPRQQWTFKEPLVSSMPYAVSDFEGDGASDTDGKHFICVTWLLDPEPMDVLTELTWSLFDHLLFGTETSVLQKALMESGLGTDVVGDGMASGLLQTTFAAGMKGVKEENVANVINLVLDVLAMVAKDGFSENDIKSSLNTIEFQLRETDSGRDPKGIGLFLATLSAWNYDRHPMDGLVFEDAIAELKNIISQSGSAIFQDLVQEFLLGNTHRVVLELFPSSTIEADQIKAEKDRLAWIKSSLSPKEFKDILKDAEYLQEIQNTDDTPEVIATIPMLTLADVDRKATEYPIEVVDNAFQSGVTLITHEVESSSGIAYADFGWDISNIAYDDIPLIFLLGQLMKEAGTTKLTDVELRQLIGMNTGGVFVSTEFLGVWPEGADDHIVTSGNNFRTMMFIKGKCTSDKSMELFDIMRQILLESNLDSKDKVITFLKENLSDLESSVPSSGHSYAARRIRSHYSPLGFVGEKTSGVMSISSKKVLLKQANEDWPSLLERLVRMRQIMLSGGRDGMILNLSGDNRVLTTIQDSVMNFLQNQLPAVSDPPPPPLPDFSVVDHPWVAPIRAEMEQYAPIGDEGIVVSTQVSYIGEGGLMYDYGEKVPGSTEVITKYLKTGYLWETVRVKNGAYGAFAAMSTTIGLFLMVSYRDPNFLKTLEAYGGAADSLFEDASTSLADNNGPALTKAIIGAIGDMDGSAISTRGLGWASLERWLSGQSAAMRQNFRDEVLATTAEDFTEFASRLNNWKYISTASITSQSGLEEAATGGMNLNVVSVG